MSLVWLYSWEGYAYAHEDYNEGVVDAHKQNYKDNEACATNDPKSRKLSD